MAELEGRRGIASVTVFSIHSLYIASSTGSSVPGEESLLCELRAAEYHGGVCLCACGVESRAEQVMHTPRWGT